MMMPRNMTGPSFEEMWSGVVTALTLSGTTLTFFRVPMKDKTSLEPTGAHAFSPMPTVCRHRGGRKGKLYDCSVVHTCLCSASDDCMAINHIRHTALGIDENRAFSINVPTVRQVSKTDYCGIASGAKVTRQKYSLVLWYIQAPMARECPKISNSVSNTS